MKNIGRNGPVPTPVTQSPVIEELVPDAPEKKSRRFKRTELDDSMYLETDEVTRLFAVIKSKRDLAIFRIVYHRGLRAHEVGILQFADWRDRESILYIHRGKGSISREHILTKEESRCLRAYIKERGNKPGPLFPSRQGKRGITRYRLDQLMKLYCAAAGIRPAKAHMHALKHSCGTHLAERGNAPDEVQDWLGHRDSASTDIYMHFTKRRREAVVEKNRDWK